MSTVLRWTPEGRVLRWIAVAALVAVGAGPVGDEQCRVCHGSTEILSRGESLFVPAAMLAGSVHESLACVDCHGRVRAEIHADRAQELERTRGSCLVCHAPAAGEYEQSAHGSSSGVPEEGATPPPSEQRQSRPAVRPTCVSCHGSHEMEPATARPFAMTLAARCSSCHDERGESFFGRDYHGKASRLGRTDVAVCSDCHGGHLVLPTGDPRSMVSRANVLQTCRGCHEAAPENFADVIVHVGGWPLPADPKLRVVTVWMTLLLVVTFGFFGIHTVLAIRSAWREGGRR